MQDFLTRPLYAAPDPPQTQIGKGVSSEFNRCCCASHADVPGLKTREPAEPYRHGMWRTGGSSERGAELLSAPLAAKVKASFGSWAVSWHHCACSGWSNPRRRRLGQYRIVGTCIDSGRSRRLEPARADMAAFSGARGFSTGIQTPSALETEVFSSAVVTAFQYAGSGRPSFFGFPFGRKKPISVIFQSKRAVAGGPHPNTRPPPSVRRSHHHSAFAATAPCGSFPKREQSPRTFRPPAPQPP